MHFVITKPFQLKDLERIGYLRWSDKIGQSKYDAIFAVGMIKDCGSTKTLLTVQKPGGTNIFIYRVIELKYGLVTRDITPRDGVIRKYDSYFYKGCLVSADNRGSITIITTLGEQLYKTTIDPCE